MSEARKDVPRRYIVDDAGQRMLVGLTVEEALEFEALGCLRTVENRFAAREAGCA